MAQGQPGERGARGTEVQVRGRVVRGVRESPLRHALVRGGSADRRVGAHDWRQEDGPEEDGPDKGEGPPATHAGFVGRGPPKPSWTIITKVTRTRWPRLARGCKMMHRLRSVRRTSYREALQSIAPRP